jgi:hypothetical protein
MKPRPHRIPEAQYVELWYDRGPLPPPESVGPWNRELYLETRGIKPQTETVEALGDLGIQGANSEPPAE